MYGLSETTASSFQSMPGDSIDLVAETVGYIQDHTEAKVQYLNTYNIALIEYSQLVDYIEFTFKDREVVTIILRTDKAVRVLIRTPLKLPEQK